MQLFKLIFCIIIFCINFVHSGIYDIIYHAIDTFYYKCEGTYFKKDFNRLETELKTHLFGQPLVHQIVLSALKGHLNDNVNPSKPLALSFHGWPGSGKNYVSDFIIKSLYHEEHESKHVHLYVSKIHFPLESQVHKYQIKLRDEIKASVATCKHSLFIFDEVDKYPAGVLDAVKPFLDYKVLIDGVDYRYSIFIFLSNIGSSRIVSKTLDLWKSGKNRNDYQLRDFEKYLTIDAFNEQGGMYRSEMIDSHLIDYYVPFLPLEREHVMLCIRAEFRKQFSSFDKDIAEDILEDIHFGPEPENIFSTSGCKRISQLLSGKLSRKRWKHEL